MVDRLDRVAMSGRMMQRWREAAVLLDSTSLMLELQAVMEDPTRHNLLRAAKVARHIQLLTAGDVSAIAHATATELEELAKV